MATRKILCHHCCARLGKDEREHYVYQCAACVMSEHDLLVRWHRGEDHPDHETLFSGPVEIAGIERRPTIRAKAA